MVRRLIVCGLAALVAVGSLASGATAMRDNHTVWSFDDPEHECFEVVPEAASIRDVSDDGRTVDLDVLVLLDGMTKKTSRSIVSSMQQTYEPAAIEFDVHFRRVRFAHDGIAGGMDDVPGPTGDAQRLIADSKELLGGGRPRGIDLVLVLTNKDIYIGESNPNYGLAGLADCIGGIRYDDHAFAISEGVTPYTDLIGAKAPSLFAAHELGHLLGAHHHYANCVEGSGSDTPCTAMWTVRIELVSPKFGSLETAVVRGHALSYGS